ncbi:MAG: Vms1/Ankzf1 family peptidyl-tRNA hydrolase [Dehalococcoidia bacterium]
MAVIDRFDLSRSQTLRRLNDLAARDILFTVYIKPATPKAEIEKALHLTLDRGEMLDTLVEKATGSPTGAAVFYAMGRGYVVRPPFPLFENGPRLGYDPEPLKSALEKDRKLGLILVRLGRYAVGVFNGDKMLAGKAGTGLVHARHHKGGSSANRFARHREKQMEYFFTRIEEHAREILGPHIDNIEYVLYGGARDTLTRMWKQCAFFELLRPKTLDRLITVREPRRSTFDDALKQAYGSAVYEIIE